MARVKDSTSEVWKCTRLLHGAEASDVGRRYAAATYEIALAHRPEHIPGGLTSY